MDVFKRHPRLFGSARFCESYGAVDACLYSENGLRPHKYYFVENIDGFFKLSLAHEQHSVRPQALGLVHALFDRAFIHSFGGLKIPARGVCNKAAPPSIFPNIDINFPLPTSI